jgi:hypothetical protein
MPKETGQLVIRVERIEYFGRITVRPLCDTAKGFAALLGQTTLTDRDVEHIKRLGYEVRVERKEKES